MAGIAETIPSMDEKEAELSDLRAAIQNWYQITLIAEQFPAAVTWTQKLTSPRALKQHFAERRFVREKRIQILAITHALGLVSLFKQLPNPPQSEVRKVVMSIERAIEMDPDLPRRDHDMVRDALSFLRQHSET